MAGSWHRTGRLLGCLLLSSVVLPVAGAHGGTLTLSWVDDSSDEAGFEVQRKTGPAGAYTGITTLAADVTTYVDTALTTGTAYCYRVRAFNGAGYSAYSNEACSTARPDEPAPPPTGTPGITLLSAGPADARYRIAWSPGTAPSAEGPVSYRYAAGYNDGSATRNGTTTTTTLTLTMAYHASGRAGTAYICVRTVSQAGGASAARCNGFTVPARTGSTPAAMPGRPEVSLMSTDAAGAHYHVTWGPPTAQQAGTPVPSYRYAAGYNDGSAARTGAVQAPSLTLTMAYHAGGRAGTAYICVKAVGQGGALSDPRCNGFTVPARSNSPPPPMPGRPTVSLVSSDAVGANYHVTWSPSIDPQAGTPVPSYSYAAGHDDGGGARIGAVQSPALMLGMPYHGSGLAGDAYICVRAVNQAGVRSETRCNGFRVPDRPGGAGNANAASVSLTVVKAGLGSGTVTSTPAGVACNATCAVSFPPATRLTLTATPGPGSVFTGWTDGPCRGDRACALTLASTVTVTATFDRQPSERPVQIVAAAGAGREARVRGFTAAGAPTVTDFLAYGPEYSDGLSLAVGSLPGLAQPAILTGTGAGGAAEVRAFRTDNSDTGLRFQPYGADFSGGVRVALCDLKGDGTMEIVTAPGPGRPPTVTVWRVNGAAVSKRLDFPVAPARFWGGVFVACADVDGDGAAEIITGLDAGGAPEVRVFTVKATGASETTRFYAHESPFTGGVRVAAADLDGDGRAEIVTGLGPGEGPVVTVFGIGPSGASPVARLHGYEADFTGGVFVAAGARENGRARLFVSPGPGAEPVVRVFADVGGMIAELGEFPASGTPSLDGATIGAAR